MAEAGVPETAAEAVELPERLAVAVALVPVTLVLVVLALATVVVALATVVLALATVVVALATVALALAIGAEADQTPPYELAMPEPDQPPYELATAVAAAIEALGIMLGGVRPQDDLHCSRNE